MQTKKNQKISGFTLIEALILLFIFSLITLSFYSIFSLGTRYIIDNKNRLGAVSLANEKMEIIRNLKYEDVGVSGGIPDGNIIQDEDVSENGRQFHVHTFVQFIDDPTDGTLGGSPNDTVPNDYKRVKITVSWNSISGSTGEVFLISRFVPPGIEVLSGDGILFINVYSDQPGGTGIPQSTVHITNNDVSPAVNVTTETDNSGNIMLPGAKQSIQGYQIMVSKGGFETVNTMPPYPLNPYDPMDMHASVIAGSVNVANIVQNELTNIKIVTADHLGQAIGNIDFSLSGGRKLGADHFTGSPVYNFNSSDETGTNGEKEYIDISPGQYTFVPSIPSTYELVGIDPISPFPLLSNENKTINVKLADKNVASLLVKVVRADDNTPVANAQVQLTNGSGYDVTQNTDNSGAAFFPNDTNPFLEGTYNLKVSASGLVSSDSQTTISNGALKTENISLSST